MPPSVHTTTFLRRHSRALLTLFLTVGAGICPARAGDVDLEAGRPFLQRFGLRDYHAHGENWEAAQDGRGVLYSGNKNVVLEYDGVTWRKLPVPGTTFVRGVAFDPKTDAVFVSAVDELGYLRLDPGGGRTFVSLLDRLPARARDFRHIRRVYATAAGEIFFVADIRPNEPVRTDLPLPPEEVRALLELSRRGDSLRIRRCLADLRAVESRHTEFIEPLQSTSARDVNEVGLKDVVVVEVDIERDSIDDPDGLLPQIVVDDRAEITRDFLVKTIRRRHRQQLPLDSLVTRPHRVGGCQPLVVSRREKRTFESWHRVDSP